MCSFENINDRHSYPFRRWFIIGALYWNDDHISHFLVVLILIFHIHVFLSSLFSNFVILILTVKSRLNSYRSQFASCTLKWSIIWSEYEAGNIYAYIGEGMQRLGKHSPWYVESKEIPFSMNITARSVLTNANGFKYIFILNDTYLNKVWFRYQLHFLTLDCINFSSCTYCMYNPEIHEFPHSVA